jgi:hypothetical protein
MNLILSEEKATNQQYQVWFSDNLLEDRHLRLIVSQSLPVTFHSYRKLSAHVSIGYTRILNSIKHYSCGLRVMGLMRHFVEEDTVTTAHKESEGCN